MALCVVWSACAFSSSSLDHPSESNRANTKCDSDNFAEFEIIQVTTSSSFLYLIRHYAHERTFPAWSSAPSFWLAVTHPSFPGTSHTPFAPCQSPAAPATSC